MPLHRVARVEEIPPGRTLFVKAGNDPIVLAHWEGKIYAFHGLCRHQNLPLEGATLWGNLLECPWHHFLYDVRTGENHYPRNVYPASDPGLQEQVCPLPAYRVEVRQGEVWVEV